MISIFARVNAIRNTNTTPATGIRFQILNRNLTQLESVTYQNTHSKPAIMWVFVVGSYSIRVITDARHDGQVIICGSGPTCGAMITETTANI